MQASKTVKSKIRASSDENERWLADKGSTSHITTCNQSMTNVKEVNVRVDLVGDSKEVICKERGDVALSAKQSDQ